MNGLLASTRTNSWNCIRYIQSQMPAFVLQKQLQVQICKFTNSLRLNTGNPQAALNATAAFFWGCMGCFPQTNKPMKLKLFGSLSFFFFSSRDTIPSSRSFLSFHFCEGNELHPGIPEGPRKADLHQTRCSLCEFKSHPKSTLFQDNIYVYFFQAFAPSISTTFGVYHCQWNE